MKPLVSITMVTFNSAEHIQACLESIFAQNYSPLEVLIVDNSSTDGTRAMLERTPFPIQLEVNSLNRGFCGGQNQAIRRAKGEWVLCLNPDTRLTPGFLRELVRAGELDGRIGAICPKILRMGPDGSPPAGAAILDSTGVYFNRFLRHHDRGSQEIDRGQYETPEYVFGFTGAAVLFRRVMLEDVSMEGQIFDEDFFAYREDGDLSWRGQLLGWHCVYTPYAVAYHVRRVFASNRSLLPKYIKLQTPKNRFLMRIKNITPGVYRRVFIRATLRDVAVVGFVLLREWSSLPGLWFVIKNWKRIWGKRSWIQSKRRVSDDEITRWLNDGPTAFPLEPELLERLSSRTPV